MSFSYFAHQTDFTERSSSRVGEATRLPRWSSSPQLCACKLMLAGHHRFCILLLHRTQTSGMLSDYVNTMVASEAVRTRNIFWYRCRSPTLVNVSVLLQLAVSNAESVQSETAHLLNVAWRIASTVRARDLTSIHITPAATSLFKSFDVIGIVTSQGR